VPCSRSCSRLSSCIRCRIEGQCDPSCQKINITSPFQSETSEIGGYGRHNDIHNYFMQTPKCRLIKLFMTLNRMRDYYIVYY
jgi:hypothetical protein